MTVRVRLIAGEFIVPRGTARTTWLGHDGQCWRLLRDFPNVELTPIDPGPQVVWETLAEVPIEPGTWLEKIERRPAKNVFDDPMRYLEGEVRRARERVRRQYFIVGPRGELRRPPRGASPPPPNEDPPD